jgi:molecular chaperone DnaK
MSEAEGTGAGGGQGPEGAGSGPDPEQLTPEQEQMLQQMEEEMRRVRVQDLVAQSVVSIINLAYRRIAKEDERDLEQARVGIEAVRGMVGALDEESQHEIRNALSQLQMLYAQQSGEGGEGGGGGAGPGPAAGAPPGGGGAGGGTSEKAPPRLWTPGSD